MGKFEMGQEEKWNMSKKSDKVNNVLSPKSKVHNSNNPVHRNHHLSSSAL